MIFTFKKYFHSEWIQEFLTSDLLIYHDAYMKMVFTLS